MKTKFLIICLLSIFSFSITALAQEQNANVQESINTREETFFSFRSDISAINGLNINPHIHLSKSFSIGGSVGTSFLFNHKGIDMQLKIASFSDQLGLNLRFDYAKLKSTGVLEGMTSAMTLGLVKAEDKITFDVYAISLVLDASFTKESHFGYFIGGGILWTQTNESKAAFNPIVGLSFYF